MCPYNWYWCELHLDNGIFECAFFEMVFSASWFRSSTFVWNEIVTSSVSSRYVFSIIRIIKFSNKNFLFSIYKKYCLIFRLPIVDEQWFIQFDSVASSSRTGAYQLSGYIARTVRLPTRALAALFDHRVNYQLLKKHTYI